MKFIPQIRLRAIFLLFFCVAVGLATYPDSPEALQTAIQTGMVAGLLQQAGQLRRAKSSPSFGDPQFSFAGSFAVVWRLVLALVMAIATAVQMLVERNLLELPEEKDLLFIQPSISVVLQLCMIVVLSNSILRWRLAALDRSARLWRVATQWILSIALAMIVLPDLGLMHFLVHLATEGIESDHPLKFQRAGKFLRNQHAAFRLFWLTTGALAALVLAGCALVALNSARVRQSFRRPAFIAFAILTSLVAAFAVWYHGIEFGRISPDLAAAGLTGSWVDRLEAITLLVILVTVVTYRLSCFTVRRLIILNDEREPVPFHESFSGLLLIASSAILMTVLGIRGILTMWAAITLAEFIEVVIMDPHMNFLVAVTVLSLQLCWVRWCRRKASFAWELKAIDGRRFLWNWLAVALMVIIGLPTISAYCFVYWLGPWYLYGPK